MILVPQLFAQTDMWRRHDIFQLKYVYGRIHIYEIARNLKYCQRGPLSP